MTTEQKAHLSSFLELADLVVHGNAVGADEQAHIMAHAVGQHCDVWPSLLKETQSALPRCEGCTYHPIQAPLDRNHDIVEAGSLLAAFPADDHEIVRSGTWAAVRYARTLGTKPIVIVWPGGGYVSTPSVKSILNERNSP